MASARHCMFSDGSTIVPPVESERAAVGVTLRLFVTGGVTRDGCVRSRPGGVAERVREVCGRDAAGVDADGAAAAGGGGGGRAVSGAETRRSPGRGDLLVAWWCCERAAAAAAAADGAAHFGGRDLAFTESGTPFLRDLCGVCT